MRAQILCPGPSLPAAPSRDGYDVVLGVNRAVGVAPCDYWVMLDGALVWRISRPVGHPVIVCSHSMHKELWDNYLDSRDHKWLDAMSFKDKYCTSMEWAIFSATTAVICAASLGATQIDMWGADMAGTREFDGPMPERATRNEARWEREARILDRISNHLWTRGVKVERKGVGHAHPV